MIDRPVTWQVKAPAEEVNQAILSVVIAAVPLDRNSNKQALVARDTVRLVMQIVRFDLSITRVFISAPEGATDDTLSTGQAFTITARIAFSQDLLGRPRFIRLEPPPGYTLLTPAVINDFLEEETWNLIAPSQPHGPRAFVFTAQGTTGSNETVTSSDTLTVVLVSRALLELQAFISEPEGARDNNLTMGQRFTIRANLNNLGTAGTLDSALVRVEPGQTGITILDSPEKAIAVNGFVEWPARAPNRLSEGNITVRLLRRPLDENTGLDADVVSEIARFFVRVDTSGQISVAAPIISGPAGAVDGILSTEQEFTVSAEIEWQKLRQVSAELLLPVGFFTEEARRNFADSENRASPSWIVRAPSEAGTGLPLRVRVQAVDANNDSLRFEAESEALRVDVVEKAVLRLSGAITWPPAATDGIVSVGQPFEVTAFVVNEGAANIIGTDRVRIVLPEGYATEDSLVKSTIDQKATWRLRAKHTPSAGFESIRLVLEKRPNDENTGRPADVVVGEVAISIQTEPRLLMVRYFSARPAGPTAAGESGVPMLSLVFENQGREASADMLLRGITFHALDQNGESVAPSSVMRTLQITRHGRPAEILATYSSMPGENPITVTFAQLDTLRAGVPDTLDVVVDLAAQIGVSGFQLRILKSDDIDAIDADSRLPVQVVDETGKTGSDFLMVSNTSVVTEAEYENFYNYPNPFRPGDPPDGGTRFWYYLPRNSRVEFKILTLLGEVVYQKVFEADSPQGRAGSRIPGVNDIFWDGKNGDGQVVLNGVYLAVLKTEFGVVTTKVAVAK